MTIAVALEDPVGKNKLQTCPSPVNPNKQQLAVINDAEFYAVFKATTVASASTTVIAAPDQNGTLLLTDLLLTAKKTANGTVTVRFEDGTNTINIIVAETANVPVSIAMTFRGRVLGWKDSRIEMITDQNIPATLTLVYVKIPIGLSFSEWDGLR